MYGPKYRALKFILKAASYEGLIDGLSVFFRLMPFGKVHRDVVKCTRYIKNKMCLSSLLSDTSLRTCDAF
jgi:hypothetical protein